MFWVKFVALIVVRLKNQSVCGWFDRLLEILKNSQFDITRGNILPQAPTLPFSYQIIQRNLKSWQISRGAIIALAEKPV